MLHALVGTFIVAATLGTIAVCAMPSGHGVNRATIYQSSPFGSAATIEVKQRDDVTIIESHDQAGNSATIIQQR